MNSLLESALAAHVPPPARPGRARQHARGAGVLGDRPGSDPAAGIRDRLTRRHFS